MPETRTVTFNYTGSVQTWTVPSGVRQVTIDCYGAQGANGSFNFNTTTQGGRGGRARGTFNVTPGETLYIYVGGQGLGVSGADSYNGGWNGGGRPARRNDGKYSGQGGGGASDVRRGGQSLNDRIIVAGGGGGAGSLIDFEVGSNIVSYLAGGHGGGLTGTDAGSYSSISFEIYGGRGGTQTEGGQRGRSSSSRPAGDGSFGNGGHAADQQCGAGGGGWYGGGGGDGVGGGGGGGGGSGYIHPSATNQLFETGVRSGHGLVIITYEVIPPLYVRVNGQLRESESIHVKVNGQLREVDRIWTRVNGQLREV